MARNAYFKLNQDAPLATVDDLPTYDAIAVGNPTRYALEGKVGAAFTSTATQHGGQETTLFSVITNLMHFGMVIVGLPYSYKAMTTVDEVAGGAPYGATTIADGDGSRQPSTIDLDGARYQGELVARTALKLHG